MSKRKVVSYVIDGILGLIIVFLLSIQIQMMVTQRSNFGVPKAYGHSFLYVATDSMVGERSDSLNVGTGIIIESVDPAALRAGDVITFYDESIGAPNTHRIQEDPTYDGTHYVIHTKGDNVNSERYTPDYQGEYFTSDHLIGRVIAHSDFLGTVLSYVSPSASGAAAIQGRDTGWVFPLIVLTPVALIAAVSIISTGIDVHKDRKAEEAEIALAMAEAGIDLEDEAAVTKFTEKWHFKKEYREELEKEKEKAKKKARAELRAERRRNPQ